MSAMTQAPYASIGKVFPVTPEPSDLRKQYDHLRKAAITVNRSRSQYIRQVRERDQLIDQLQEEISNYAKDAKLDYQERAQLLGILTKYRDVFSSLEKAGDEMIEGVEEYQKGRGSFQGARPIQRLLAACYAFMRAWKAAKEIHDVQQIEAGI